ncbi:MAG: cation:proton antiporter [Prevotella sp.]|nr:cation:proton antiporter [Prevotella sp.]
MFLDIAYYFPITDPTAIFFVVLCIILFAPIIMGKLRIPHIVGMVLAGVLIGQYGLNILQRDDSFELFGQVGIYYIMFLAGLEMDLENLKKNMWRMVVFGLTTFAIPFIITFFLGTTTLHYGIAASLILGCIMSSNTLVAYPIVGRYGLQRHSSVVLSVGGTMVALFMALVVLASIAGSYQHGGGALFWLWFIVKLALYVVGMVMLVPRLTRWFLRRYSDAVMQFIFILAELTLSAFLSELVGLEGIFGAFLSGIILNRYIPRLSPLMNRIEFIGNALFIPYFLIGVGMLINVRILFEGGAIIWVVLLFVLVGTFGKGIAAYVTCISLRLPLTSGHMMFGLTSAHAAGAIAMVMVGRRLETSPGEFLVSDDMLNGVVIMVLFTCIISTIITERISKRLILAAKAQPQKLDQTDDEKILIPVKYRDVADKLINTAILMRNAKLNRGMVALNVVYDDEKRQQNQVAGRELLDMLVGIANASDVRMQTQVRVAANIANGIKHAFKEFDASEIVMGMHIHKEVSPKFWGEFAQSLYNGLDRQIIFVRLKQPLNTLRRIQVAVPSRSEFEPGFHRWLERLERLADNLECRIDFHGRENTLQLIEHYTKHQHPNLRARYVPMPHWNKMPQLASNINSDHLFVVVTARKGTMSYKTALERLPDEIEQHFSGKNLMIVFPDQYGERMDGMTFAEPQHQEEKSAYQTIHYWLRNLFRKDKSTNI